MEYAQVWLKTAAVCRLGSVLTLVQFLSATAAIVFTKAPKVHTLHAYRMGTATLSCLLKITHVRDIVLVAHSICAVNNLVSVLMIRSLAVANLVVE
jgi:hypothetical protein